ncbi:hypothetical protein D9619_011042 [Psilocybe cf. subviscida]|uniref:Uncharacterized protein n=1 Tax=Psilocybe cf. subviscida TaxID=2480587 RepID=A0A8H5F029_9AGAR|nr:hypothetical protein D9619_011042 [Psilocybe cf. subviscida]
MLFKIVPVRHVHSSIISPSLNLLYSATTCSVSTATTVLHHQHTEIAPSHTTVHLPHAPHPSGHGTRAVCYSTTRRLLYTPHRTTPLYTTKHRLDIETNPRASKLKLNPASASSIGRSAREPWARSAPEAFTDRDRRRLSRLFALRTPPPCPSLSPAPRRLRIVMEEEEEDTPSAADSISSYLIASHHHTPLPASPPRRRYRLPWAVPSRLADTPSDTHRVSSLLFASIGISFLPIAAPMRWGYARPPHIEQPMFRRCGSSSPVISSRLIEVKIATRKWGWTNEGRRWVADTPELPEYLSHVNNIRALALRSVGWTAEVGRHDANRQRQSAPAAA